MDEENGVHTTYYYSAMIKKEIWLFVTTWVDLGGIMLNEMSDRER